MPLWPCRLDAGGQVGGVGRVVRRLEGRKQLDFGAHRPVYLLQSTQVPRTGGNEKGVNQRGALRGGGGGGSLRVLIMGYGNALHQLFVP